MGLLPAELYALCEQVVDDQQRWNEALILEKLGFNWGIKIAYGSAGTNIITFAQPYDVAVTEADIDVWLKAFNAAGEDVGANIISGSLDNEGFSVYVPEACEFSYLAFEPKVLVPL